MLGLSDLALHWMIRGFQLVLAQEVQLQHGELTHPRVLAISRRLDGYAVEDMRRRMAV